MPKSTLTSDPARKEIQESFPTRVSEPHKQAKANPGNDKIKFDVVWHLKKLSSLLSVHDALMLSDELRKSLILALQNPKVYMTEIEQDMIVDCMTAITFSENDIPKDRDHINPLYVEGKAANKDATSCP